MSALEAEISANFEGFFKDWTTQAQKNWEKLHPNDQYLLSYRRLACFQAIKSDLVAPNFSAGSAAFFFEAHNDGLISHVNASLGSWRTALQSLRSTVENALAAVYFKDHPIELALWASGDLKPSFSELHAYCVKHPDLKDISANIKGLDVIKAEYATLSKAVHGSTTNFRMTDGVSNVLLWSTEAKRLSMWATRERSVLEGIALLYVCLFRAELAGTKKAALRNMLYFVVSSARAARIRSELKINITKAT
ncbi:MAG TPA: hypothetical protein VNW53_09405 [Phenylobacterium sp.]|jgi:hypothetical protein|uniref:hypothetical protein n=1 Tax=Phenylobacterium sp. TaxID=1871053 RepID=UPI002B972AA6|nr:hypothetical protein [Phenylobacterium sp.]HXA39204.1 hypothetical protein [Phenylobacterium sp.]